MNLLPLFPLEVVLLPGTLLPLHIFEPRYREMTADCVAKKKPFGVVRSKEEGIAEIGCTAEILTVAKQYPDGRSDIVTRGQRRFEVLQVNQERSFLQAGGLLSGGRTGQGYFRRSGTGGKTARRNYGAGRREARRR